MGCLLYTSTNTALQQKVKVLAKLYDSGCKTEKDLKALRLQSILKIPDGYKIRITLSDGEQLARTCRYIDDYHLEPNPKRSCAASSGLRS